MARRYYYLLTSLPVLPALGEAQPIDLPVLREMAQAAPAAAEVVDALLLDYDLLLREAALAGEVEAPRPAVLTVEQMGDQAPLPEALQAEPVRRLRIPADAVWEAYYRYADRVGRRRGCRLLVEWVGFEVALRNALVDARAEMLHLDSEGYRVAEDLAVPDESASQAARAFTEAPDPLKGLRRLDEARWNWVDQRGAYFSFGIDELAAYARKLVLLTRWHVLAGQPAGPAADRGT